MAGAGTKIGGTIGAGAENKLFCPEPQIKREKSSNKITSGTDVIVNCTEVSIGWYRYCFKFLSHEH